MMRIFVSFFLLFAGLQLAAQKTGYQFQTSVQAGLLEGERGSAFQFHAVNGVAYNTWSAGVGVGLDYYHTRSIPLFLQVQKTLWNKAKTPFLYVSGGYHFPWLKEEDKAQYWGTLDAKGGSYIDAGLGYQLPVLKKSSLFFTAGFSQKNFSLKQYEDVAITIWPRPEPQTRFFEFGLRRLSLKMGLRF